MSPMDDDLRALGRLGVSLREIVAGLQPDGPAVDFELLVGYIDGVLEKDATERVGKCIVTFRAWYDAFWETVGALEVEDDAPESVRLRAQPEGWLAGHGAEEIRGYLGLAYHDLMAELPAYAAAVRTDPLGPYRAVLRRVLCEEWNWSARKADPAMRDEFTLTATVADVLSGASLDMPFPVSLVAAILVKEGLDHLCSTEDSP